MEKTLFNRLIQSVRQAGGISRGESEEYRKMTIRPCGCSIRVFDEDATELIGECDYHQNLRAQRDELVEALDELYRWCNNVEIRGEGLHRGPIWFGGPALKGQGRTEEDDERFEAMEKAEQALANIREDEDG